jgi:hypothetical protein
MKYGDVIDDTQIEPSCDVWKRMGIHEQRTLADLDSAVVAITVVEKAKARFWIRGRETKATV